MKGISIIVCCYNSQKRIVTTLEYLSRLQIENINCELILINNNCTDDTIIVSENTWSDLAFPFPLLVYSQTEPGLSAAREMGIEKSRYNIVIFCDDDNWLDANYLKEVMQFFSEKDTAGIVAGANLPVFEGEPPLWFNEYQTAYAVGTIENSISNITESRGQIWGAGMAIRKSVYINLKKAGFKFISSDRIGKRIESGGDTELCFAYRCLGYEIWFHPGLILQHYIPSSRLTNKYLKKLKRSFGGVDVTWDIYKNYLFNSKKDLNWKKEALIIVKEILRQKKNFIRMILTDDINEQILSLESRYGRLKKLLLLKHKYSELNKELITTFTKVKLLLKNT